MSAVTVCQLLIIIIVSIGIYQCSKLVRELTIIREKSLHNLEFSNGFAYIDYLMDTELSYMIELPYEGKDIKRVTDFENVLVDLTNRVTNGLNERFMKMMENQGIPEDYIYEYITHGCTIRLMNYMKENISPKNEDEEE